jgi:hypothetical protein
VWTLKPTGAGPIDNTTFYAALIINSDIGHGEYMQPGWFFCVNCHGRYFAGDAPNGLTGAGPVPSAGRSTAPPWTTHWPGGLNYGLRLPQGTVGETRGRQSGSERSPRSNRFRRPERHTRLPGSRAS